MTTTRAAASASRPGAAGLRRRGRPQAPWRRARRALASPRWPIAIARLPSSRSSSSIPPGSAATPSARAEDKREFLAACEDFAADRSLRAYSTVGTRGDTDLMLLAQSPMLDDIHTFHVVLAQSGLAKWATIPHSYLAMTKPLAVLGVRGAARDLHLRAQVLHRLSARQEARVVPARRSTSAGGSWREHIEIGRRYPEITINTAYSFGLDDQEFVVSFECDDPGEFLDLVQELRGSESSAYTLRDTPIFTCVAMSVARALDALDGTAAAAALSAG